MALSNLERRILGYLDQRGGSADRRAIVCDLAPPDSIIGMGHVNGSGGHLAMLFGAWSRRLKRDGLIRERSQDNGFYDCHEITAAGRAALRSAIDPAHRRTDAALQNTGK